VGEAQLDSMNLACFAHEIGHQWWTDSVFGVGAGRSLLTEGLAQFAALRVVERLHGARAASEFRWRGYPGYGLFDNGRGYVGLMLAGLDAAPTAASVPSHLPYSKAFLLHDLLARTVGRDAFREAAKAFAQRHRFSDVTWTQFIAEIGAATGRDLASFTAQWYDRAGVPQLGVTWSQKNRQLHAVITQGAPYYAADLSIVVEGSGR
jgi:aminopeptidase N